MIRSKQFVRSLYLLGEALPPLAALSLLFQGGHLHFAHITTSLQQCKKAIADIETQQTPYSALQADWQRFEVELGPLTDDDSSSMQVLATHYCEALLANLDEDFTTSTIKLIQIQIYPLKIIFCLDLKSNRHRFPNSPFSFRTVALIALKEDYGNVKCIMETQINPETDDIMEDGFTLGGGQIDVKIFVPFLTLRWLVYWIVQEVLHVIYVLRLSPKLKA